MAPQCASPRKPFRSDQGPRDDGPFSDHLDDEFAFAVSHPTSGTDDEGDGGRSSHEAAVKFSSFGRIGVQRATSGDEGTRAGAPHGSTTTTPRQSGSAVALRVYDFHDLTRKFGIPIYHLTVEVYGKECFFATCGVLRTNTPRPGSPEAKLYRHKIPLGWTQLDISQVNQLLREFRKAWPKESYNVMGPNCQSFAVALVERLGVAGAVPQQYRLLAETGQVPRWVAAALSGLGLGSVGSVTAATERQAVRPKRPPTKIRVRSKSCDCPEVAALGPMPPRTRSLAC